MEPGISGNSCTFLRSSQQDYYGGFRADNAAEMQQLLAKWPCSAVVPPKGGSAMSEVIPFQKRPSKTIEEETAEFLKLLERIRSESQKKK
jgi:hypothetical protein